MTLYYYPAAAGGVLCWCIFIAGCSPLLRYSWSAARLANLWQADAPGVCQQLLGFGLTRLLLASWLFASAAGLGCGAVGPCPCSGFWGGTWVIHPFLAGYTLRCIGGMLSIMRVTPSLSLPLGLLRVTPRVACPLPHPSFTFLPVSPSSSLVFPLGGGTVSG